MRKRMLSILLVMCMVLALIPATAWAAESDFIIEDGVLTKYNGPGGNVIIPDGVTVIGDDAFNTCRTLSSVTIPDSTKKIGSRSFSHCLSLTSVVIPNSVIEIGEAAFYNCTCLAKITIPDNITLINNRTFYNCSSLTNVTIPENVTAIDTLAFESCSSLSSVTLPIGISRIEYGVFRKCDNLKDIYYAGSEARWKQKIRIDSGNTVLHSATIHYNNPGPGTDVDNPSENPLVNPPANQSVTVKGPNQENQLTLGEKKMIEGKVLNARLSESDVQWNSSNPSVISVTKNSVSSLTDDYPDTIAFATLEAHSEGKSTITLSTNSGLSGSVVVEVIPAGSEVVIRGTQMLSPKETGELSASIIFGTHMPSYTWVWSSSDPTVAAFDANGLVSVSRSTNAAEKYTDTVQIYARSGGTAVISCKLSDGTEKAYSVRVFTSKEQKITQAAQEWLQGYDTYVARMEAVLLERSSSVDTAALNRNVKDLSEKLEELGIRVEANLGKEEKQTVYKALLAMLVNEASNDPDFASLDISKTDELPMNIVNEVARRIQSSTFHYEDGNTTVELSINNYMNGRFGTASYKSKAKTDNTIVICSTQEAMQTAIQKYMTQLIDLDKKMMQNAYKEAYKELCNVLFDGKSISDLTEAAISKRVSKYAGKLKELGFGDTVEFFNNSFNCYQSVKKILDGDTASAVTALKNGGYDFDADKVSDIVAKKAVKMMDKALAKLIDQEAGSTDNTIGEIILNYLTTFSCPVDVSVYTEDGKQIGYVGSDDLWYDETLIYIEENGESKTVYSTGIPLSFHVIATDEGTLNCTYMELSNGEDISRANYYDIPLYSGKTIDVGVTGGSAENAVTVTSENKRIPPDKTLNSTEYKPVQIVCNVDGEQGGKVYGAAGYIPGDPVKLQAIANSGYTFLGWFDVDNALVSISTVYKFVAKEDLALTAVFADSVTSSTSAPAFTDVTANAYYYDAVAWAVENGITAGTSATKFSPDASCTRAQTVTFLWRAAGSPAPKSAENPFTDVQPGTYYYDAVLWAVENGITAGTSAITFSPDATVTRAQTVTFLYRAAGSPPVSGSSPFSDVPSNSYYASAVLWAVDRNVTAGTGAGTFSPDSDCTRAQIVTFLYRDRVKS